jgi:hypothetical protein
MEVVGPIENRKRKLAGYPLVNWNPPAPQPSTPVNAQPEEEYEPNTAEKAQEEIERQERLRRMKMMISGREESSVWPQRKIGTPTPRKVQMIVSPRQIELDEAEEEQQQQQQ